MCTLDRIKLEIDKQGKNQVDLCKYLGLNKQAFTEWNGGKNKSYVKHLPEIASFLNVSVDYLLGKEENEQDNSGIITNVDRPFLEKYNKLNDIGKNKADAYIDGLLENPSYCKSDVKMVAEMPVSVPPKVVKKKRHT